MHQFGFLRMKQVDGEKGKTGMYERWSKAQKMRIAAPGEVEKGSAGGLAASHDLGKRCRASTNWPHTCWQHIKDCSASGSTCCGRRPIAAICITTAATYPRSK